MIYAALVVFVGVSSAYIVGGVVGMKAGYRRGAEKAISQWISHAMECEGCRPIYDAWVSTQETLDPPASKMSLATGKRHDPYLTGGG